MEAIACVARFGNRLVSLLATILILAMLLYGGYSLWDMISLSRGAFLSSEMLQYKPILNEAGEVSPNLWDLIALNSDVRGWLTVDDTHIDYPVLQGRHDMEYVNKDVYGEFALAGSIFLSSENAPDFSDAYSVIYGHHVEGGGMFADVTRFTQSDFFQTRTRGVLMLPDRAFELSIFACAKLDAYDRIVYCDPTFYSSENLQTLLDYVRENAVQYRDIGVTAADRIVALSTCADGMSNNRVLVFGRLSGSDAHVPA